MKTKKYTYSFPRTETDIKNKIEELISDDTNFICDNYGSESADNGIYEIYFCKYTTEITLRNFAEWLLNNI